jgi:predicted nucleic acid-binding protein
MINCFADTWFYIALLDRDDQHHRQVVEFLDAREVMFITTRWVLAEVGNALGGTALRGNVTTLLNDLERDPSTVIVKHSDDLYRKGLKLFSARPDKNWSLTDCISFEAMKELQVGEVLTGDHHFTQAGFTVVFAKP